VIRVALVALAALVLASAAAAWAPNDPLLARQWYATQNRAFDFWLEPPLLPPVRVAVIDSGIDAGHPEFAGKIVAAKSFVGGSALTDEQGHGTFVAGVIAAAADNALGIAGLAPAAELLIAKVVTGDRDISVEAEAKAIHWAVDKGARVINMSLGGVRDPLDPDRDTFSPVERDAIAYATSHGVVVVAAVGNSDAAPGMPWRYASYPAALPHVLGVSALAKDGSSPAFSNRDAIYNDIAAPGEEILSTLPLALTGESPACVEQGYSSCGPEEYRQAEGTSFAAPQVSAAAATLLAVRPSLRPEQVLAILERSAVDATPANGCQRCLESRDSYTGWGRLDVAAALGALAGELPRADAYETNDDAGGQAYRLFFRGAARSLEATLDYWDDQNDVYAVRLAKGQALYAGLRGPPGADAALAVWSPETASVDDLRRQELRVRGSSRPGPRQYLAYRAPATGWYFLQVKLASPGAGLYKLTLVKA
jgi:subtilisin family serine protease